MSPKQEFKSVEKKFLAAIVGLAVLSVFILGAILYQTNTIRFDNQISSGELNELISDDPAVVEYLEQEKDFEAHFITIANLVKQDQQNSLGQALVYVIIPVVILVGLLGVLVARYLMKPVKEAYDSQERFLQDAAHELRNPLAAMSAAIQSAPKSIVSTDFYKTIGRQTRRLVGINEDLLFLERRKRGEKIEQVDISNLTNDVLEDLQPEIVAKKLKVTANIEEGIELTVDPLDYIKLVSNIVNNAIKYSDKSGEISVVLKMQSNKAKLVVKDSGIGIPSSELKHIGERFYRAKNVGKATGTGLGMSIVKKVLNSYGGTIDIASKEGSGTTVTVEI